MSDTPSSATERIIDRIESPQVIGSLLPEELSKLAVELREEIVATVARNGGHLAPSLGVVELTLALLSVFDVAKEPIIWDVGHQSYAYKLLTGRKDSFHSLRQFGGMSGFPKREESPYDFFGVGHSSTSISAALGAALARDLRGEEHNIVSVIGDGAMTAGMAYEALNHAGHMGKKLIVVLNDNEMSISPNVGALSLFLSCNLSSRWVRRLKQEVEGWLNAVPGIGEDIVRLARRSEHSFKGFFTPGMLFESFRFNYLGPVDGHDIKALTTVLQIAKRLNEPVLVHAITRKGKGYELAEKNPATYHGIGAFDPVTGKASQPEKVVPSYSAGFGEALCEMAATNDSIVAITAAMVEGTGLREFARSFPDRFVDVGICEQHAVTFAAGLAAAGMRPVVTLYSTFLQRAYDQVLHDVCLQNLPVIFGIDRAGIVGEDGPTHHGVFDISFLRHIPNLTFVAPRNQAMLKQALAAAIAHNGPFAIRYPRGGESAFLATVPSVPEALIWGKTQLMQEGSQVLVLAVGSMVAPALEAARHLAAETGQTATVCDICWIKPLPAEDILALVHEHSCVLIVEENALAGGLSSAILELLVDADALSGQKIVRLGIPDAFVPHGSVKQLCGQLGLDAAGIYEKLQACFG